MYDGGETANRVSGTELEREAASESMVRSLQWSFWPVPARRFVAAILQSIDFVHEYYYYLLDECWSRSTFI